MIKYLYNEDKKHGLVLRCVKCKHEWDYYPYWMNCEEKAEPKKFTSCAKCRSHVNIEVQTIATIYSKRRIEGL